MTLSADIDERNPPWIELGDQGDLVRQAQLALASIGYKLKGTGYFGPATDAAVEDFQRSQYLKADGQLGPMTARAIEGLLAHKSQTSSGPILAHPTVDRPLWLLAGLPYLNLKEGPGSKDNLEILEWAKEEGGDIAKEYIHDSIPWCSLWENHIFTLVGIKGTETLWALDWANWGTALSGPAVGAVAPMKRPGGGHVATVVGRDQNGNLMLLGGNQSDEVSIRPFPKNRPVGFRWPKGVPLPTVTSFNDLPIVRSDGKLSVKEV